MVDTHCHLDSCKPDDSELVANARANGITRLATVGMNDESIERAIAAADDLRRGLRDRRPPPERGDRLGRLRPRADRARRAARARAGDRRDRPRLLPRLRAARRPEARVRGAHRPRRAHAAAARHPHARRRGGHLRDARRARRRRHRDHALLLGARRVSTSASSAATTARSPATSPTRRRPTCRTRRARCPDELLLVETDSPYLSPQAVRGKRNEPANVVLHRRVRRRAARPVVRRPGRAGRAQRRARLRLVTRQASCASRACAACARSACGPTASSARTS